MTENYFDTVHRETEAKFIIPDRTIFSALKNIAHLGDFQLKPIATNTITDHYLDVSTKRLLYAGYACRIRTVKQKKFLTLKTLTPPEDNIHRRQEYEMEIDADHPQAWTEGRAKDLVLGIIGEESLQTLFTIHQVRHIYNVLFQDEPIIELSLDEVSLADATKVDYLELEAELLKTGTETDLRRFIDILQSKWSLIPEGLSKFERAFAQADI
jgi:inorganic triphosphatase YgiF